MKRLPDRGWPYYEAALRRLGERRPDIKDLPALEFLCELGLVTPELDSLSDQGQQYFNAAFIRNHSDVAKRIIKEGLHQYSPSIAITQLLWGVAGATKSTAETVLRSQGYAAGLTDRSLGSLLTLMSMSEIIEYAKSSGSIRILEKALDKSESPPQSAFISPATPYGNKIWLGRILGDCNGSVQWLDKHFMPAAFEVIWENADANRIKSIKILSLRLPDHEGRRTLRQYRDLRIELANRGITLEWRTIESQAMRDTHDRWIIGEREAWNVPNVNAVFTGQNSEMHRTDNVKELTRIYDQYWARATDFDPGQVT